MKTQPASTAQTHEWIRLMSKRRKELPEDSIFANNPFLEELLEWRDSPEAEQLVELSDTLYDLLEDVQLDAKQRKFIWPDAEQLDLEQSVQRIRNQCPDFSHDQIEEFLIEWIEMGYDPENYSQAQLDELDTLTAQWASDHMRLKASKKGKKTRHS
jgi:desulfoferrodoxin (superoxide reductase-like protein)